MDHVAIMYKPWNLIEKILSGEKTIESRWYLSKRMPWDRVHAGEVIYFRNAGEPVIARATVARVEQLSNLTPAKCEELVNQNLEELGAADIKSDLLKKVQNKKYCILIHLSDPVRLTPFEVDKSGVSPMVAWHYLPNKTNSSISRLLS